MPLYGPWVTRAPQTLTLSPTHVGNETHAETSLGNTNFGALCESTFLSFPHAGNPARVMLRQNPDSSFAEYLVEQFKIWWSLGSLVELIPFRTGWVDTPPPGPPFVDHVQTIDPLTGAIIDGEVPVNNGWITSASFDVAFLANHETAIYHPQNATIRVHPWNVTAPVFLTAQVLGADLTTPPPGVDIDVLGLTDQSVSAAAVPIAPPYLGVDQGVYLSVAYLAQNTHAAPAGGTNSQSVVEEWWGASAAFSSALLTLHYQQPPWRFVYKGTPPVRQRQRHTGTGAAYNAPLRQRASLGDVDAPLRQRRTL